MKKILGGVELGGTKIICAIGTSSGKILESQKISTGRPEKNIPEIISFFQKAQTKQKLAAIGIASFGPIIVDPSSAKYGYLAKSVKPFWANCNLAEAIQKTFNLPVKVDTDVNAAALAEYLWGAGKNLDSLVYWTIGTGIGAGAVINGKIVHGLMHPEIGHSFVPHDKMVDPFEGSCPYHKTCLEGLASGSALTQRWQVKKATDLPEGHPGWELEAEYLSYGMANAVFFLSPRKMIIGGGVMRNKKLLPMIRKKTLQKLNGFIPERAILEKMDEYIVSPGLRENSGICGALAVSTI